MASGGGNPHLDRSREEETSLPFSDLLDRSYIIRKPSTKSHHPFRISPNVLRKIFPKGHLERVEGKIGVINTFERFDKLNMPKEMNQIAHLNFKGSEHRCINNCFI